jgi:hypothetical protein
MSHDRTGGDRYDQAALPAGFTVETCIVVTCRTCQRAYGDEEDGVTVHFPDPDAAACTVTEAGWWVTQHGAQCRPCAAAEACQSLGHAWPDWALCGCGGRIPTHVRQMEYRTCASCGEQEERIAQTTSGA